jgi:5-formyltetrahydrofolate cyclo-ligase
MKNSLRKEFLIKREMLSEQDWDKYSTEIQNRLLESLSYQKASSVLVYCHFDREVKTDLFVGDALRRGKAVYVPFVDWEKRRIIPSRIYSLQDIDREGRKVPQPFIPRFLPENENIELAVIPGVVFDVYGNRIGMGKGFFDRFLAGYGDSMLKVSLAFDFQVLEEKLPVESWDRSIDIIITEKRVIRKRGQATFYF